MQLWCSSEAKQMDPRSSSRGRSHNSTQQEVGSSPAVQQQIQPRSFVAESPLNHSQKTKSIFASESSKFYGLICAKKPFLLLVLNLLASRASQGCPYPNHLSYLTHDPLDPRPLSPPPKQSLSSMTHCPSPEFIGVPFRAYSTLAHSSRKGAPGVILAHVLMLK